MAYHGQLMAMGTRLDLVLPAVASSRGELLLSKVAFALEQWEQALSTHRFESSAMLVNRRLAQTQSSVVDDPLLWQALQFAEQAYTVTQGWFNIACGRLYRAYKEDAAIDQAQVDAMADAKFRLDTAERRVSVDNAHALLDFGGLGKGLALDEIKQLLLDDGIESGFVSFGESSILALGRHPNGEYWPVAVNHPTLAHQHLLSLTLRDCFLSLSSSVANGANSGQFQAHLVNPKNGRLINELRTVATVSKHGVMGEIVSTAKLVAGEQWSAQTLTGNEVASCQLFIHEKKPGNHSV